MVIHSHILRSRSSISRNNPRGSPKEVQVRGRTRRPQRAEAGRHPAGGVGRPGRQSHGATRWVAWGSRKVKTLKRPRSLAGAPGPGKAEWGARAPVAVASPRVPRVCGRSPLRESPEHGPFTKQGQESLPSRSAASLAVKQELNTWSGRWVPHLKRASAHPSPTGGSCGVSVALGVMYLPGPEPSRPSDDSGFLLRYPRSSATQRSLLGSDQVVSRCCRFSYVFGSARERDI